MKIRKYENIDEKNKLFMTIRLINTDMIWKIRIQAKILNYNYNATQVRN